MGRKGEKEKEVRVFYKLLIFLVFLSLNCFAETTKEFQKLADSTLILYTQRSNGVLETACTGTIFDKNQDGKHYRVLTSAHCIVEKNLDGKRDVIKRPLFFTADEDDKKLFLRATIEKVGNLEAGYDLAVLIIETEKELTVASLGDSTKVKDGESILNVSVPDGLGKVCLHGFISKALINRPLEIESEGIDLMGFMLVQMDISNGASGSAIFSISQDKIIGVLTGTIGNNAIAVPISRLQDVLK